MYWVGFTDLAMDGKFPEKVVISDFSFVFCKTIFSFSPIELSIPRYIYHQTPL